MTSYLVVLVNVYTFYINSHSIYKQLRILDFNGSEADILAKNFNNFSGFIF